MDDDREAFEFAYTLFLAREVDREAAQMTVGASEVGQIEVNQATDLPMQLSGNSSERHLIGWCTSLRNRRTVNC